jgi:hypothetical protein
MGHPRFLIVEFQQYAQPSPERHGREASAAAIKTYAKDLVSEHLTNHTQDDTVELKMQIPRPQRTRNDNPLLWDYGTAEAVPLQRSGALATARDDKARAKDSVFEPLSNQAQGKLGMGPDRLITSERRRGRCLC